jgi:Nif-specific regulatory protein
VPLADTSPETQQLAALVAVNQALSGSPSLRAALRRVLDIVDHQDGGRSAITLAADGAQVRIEASGAAEAPRTRDRLGDGVTARVLESGKPVVVPQVSRELTFGTRAPAAAPVRNETSFLCVPITLNRKTAGALSVHLPFRADRDYDRSVAFLKVIASMVAQAVKVDRLVDAERQKLIEENTHLREELRQRYDFSHIIGNSGPMRQVYEQITQVASTSTTVLIRGESGTGKELIAHAIHYNSPRSGKPFVKVSCAALPDSLIESELFGYEKGAFTGAEARKKGGSSWPTAARCSSTRSATCRCRPR